VRLCFFVESQKNHIRLIYLIVLILSFLKPTSHACELNLTVGINEDWPPYVVKTKGNFEGLEVDILDLVLERASFCANFTEIPSSSRAFREFSDNKIDLIFAASLNEARQSYAKFSVSYREEEMRLFRPKNTPSFVNSDIDSFAELDPALFLNSIIAVNRGSIYGEVFDTFRKNFDKSIVETNLARQRFDLLKKHRVDYSVEDRVTGLALLSEAEYANDVTGTKIVVHKNPIYYMLRPGVMTNEQIQKFNQSIQDSQLKIDQLIKRYTMKFTIH
jgi:polar amino acid transport system substrate-binding protein